MLTKKKKKVGTPRVVSGRRRPHASYAPGYYSCDMTFSSISLIVIVFFRCDIGDISTAHQARQSRFQSGSFLNVLSLFVVVGVMSESREEAGEPPPVPKLQESKKNLKELGPLKSAKSAIWLHFCLRELRMVEAKLVIMNKINKEVECGHCGASVKHKRWQHY